MDLAAPEGASGELTSFGMLFTHAVALETRAAALAGQAVAQAAAGAEKAGLEGCAGLHRRRVADLERLRRERLNVVVLQPVAGMARERYVFPETLPAEARASAGVLGQVEEILARFYEDGARAAGAWAGLERVFRRYAAESRAQAARLP